MKKFLTFLSLTVIILSTCGCSKSNFEPLTLQEQAEYLQPHTTRHLLTMPISKRAELIEYNCTAGILSDFLKLRGTEYYIDISQKDAQAMGVSKRMYKKHQEQVKRTSASINKLYENADSIKLLIPGTCRDTIIYKKSNPLAAI